MLNKSARTAIAATARACGATPEQIAATMAAMEDRIPKGEISALAVQQARACELLSCSRHHIRKLEKMGLLTAVELAGIRRYRIADIMKLLGVEQ